MFNPFASWKVSGTWEAHASYSAGGTDYPTPYDTPIPSPAAGTLRYDGWVGTAGRRATLLLDRPVARVFPRSATRMLGGGTEAEGPMVAVVFQHLSAAPTERWYAANTADMIRTGASASGKDWGGDAHMHVHGLDAAGRRLDFTKFIGSAPAGGGTASLQGEDMKIIRHPNTTITKVGELTFRHYTNMADYLADAAIYGAYKNVTADEHTRIVAGTQIARAYFYAGMPGGGGGSSVDEAAIAEKVKQTLADDFARDQAAIAALAEQLAALDGLDADDLAAVTAAAKAGAKEALADLTLVVKQ